MVQAALNAAHGFLGRNSLRSDAVTDLKVELEVLAARRKRLCGRFVYEWARSSNHCSCQVF